MNAQRPKQTLDLGMIGNGQVSALIDPEGALVWLCHPRLDSDPVFGGLLDGGAPDGAWTIEAAGTRSIERRYMRNTPILETRIACADQSALRIVDFAPRFKRHGRIFRPPMIVRRIEPTSGTPRIRIRIRPRDLRSGQPPSSSQGSHHLRYAFPGGGFRVTSDAPLSYVQDEIEFTLLSPLTFVLGPDEALADDPAHLGVDWIAETEAYWLEWVRYLSLPYEWQEQVVRAAITLKLCQYEDTGAVVAAITTSVPEAPGSSRNWDYRFCWLRDAFHVVYALNLLGATRTMEEFIRFATDVAGESEAGTLRPLYPIVARIPPPEEELARAAGYRGHKPVRLGNAAAFQVQNDVYGSVILAAAQMFFDERLPRMGDWSLYQKLVKLGHRAREVALTPDAGIWEYRGRTSIHTHSAVMCWAGLDRLARIAKRLGDHTAAQWRADADKLHAEIVARAWDEKRQAFVGTLDGGEMDGAVLVMPMVGFLRGDDPRLRTTLDAIERELDLGGFIARYAHADDFGKPESSFVVCSFWYAEALAAAGEVERARAVFDRVMGQASSLGLFSEDILAASGEHWGNFPQTYCMAGLVGAAMRLSRGWREGVWDGSL